MAQNAAYIEEIYQAVKAGESYQRHYQGKMVIIVLGNAPAHSQSELRCVPHDDMCLVRLGPYSPMLNPIERCFSVLKAPIKRFLALRTDDTFDLRNFNTYLEARMSLLEAAAFHSMVSTTQPLVVREALFC
ncbi:hypothetical protein LEN26_010647 [Aphanomyces euteiches]|nr:hypothetical protein LEN26_010647 [Aphanomyces euteiches]KAH9127743.1 hypothetical protein AeMF1_002000 [Aphanomyces euteiches]KAH9187869.1 hypothetical protein AeNC1_010155 [Aphanomyces euteiches]